MRKSTLLADNTFHELVMSTLLSLPVIFQFLWFLFTLISLLPLIICYQFIFSFFSFLNLIPILFKPYFFLTLLILILISLQFLFCFLSFVIWLIHNNSKARLRIPLFPNYSFLYTIVIYSIFPLSRHPFSLTKLSSTLWSPLKYRILLCTLMLIHYIFPLYQTKIKLSYKPELTFRIQNF